MSSQADNPTAVEGQPAVEKQATQAEAGLGGTDRENAAAASLTDKPANGAPANGPADGTSTEKASNDAELELKPTQSSGTKERSTAKIALIMLSLCV